MKRFLPSTIRTSALLAILVVGGVLAPGPAFAACLSPVEARRAVAAGEAMRLGEIAALVDGDIVNAELCENGGGLVYRLAVLRGGGEVITVVVDARSGTVIR